MYFIIYMITYKHDLKEGIHMIRWIYDKLIQKRDKERQSVLRLKWKKAELEQLIEEKKKEAEKNRTVML